VFLDPNYAKAYNNIGVVYYIQKNIEEPFRTIAKRLISTTIIWTL